MQRGVCASVSCCRRVTHASLHLEAGRPADAGQGVDQRAALDAEGAADRRLGGAAVERRDHRGELLGIDRDGTAAPTAATARGREPGLYALLDQRPLELRQRAEDMEQELALRRGGVHLLGERTERDAALLEVVHRGQQMRQRPAEPVQLPDHQAIAGPDEGQRLCQAGAVVAAAAGVILEQVPLIDPGGEKGVALQVQHLPVAVGRDAHVADQHVRKTPSERFPHSASFRQGLSCSFWADR